MPQLSLNAIRVSFKVPHQTMRVKGVNKKRSIHVLIDSGSTHNFIDQSIAKRLGCVLRKIPPVEIIIANGEKVISSCMCE